MILLLNYLPLIIAAIGVAAAYRFRGRWHVILIVTALLMVATIAATPSYMPKGEVRRSTTPDFVPSTAVHEDRLKAPAKSDAERAEHYAKRTDWQARVDEGKKEANRETE